MESTNQLSSSYWRGDRQTRCQGCAIMVRSTEPPGEHCYENWAKKKATLLEGLSIEMTLEYIQNWFFIYFPQILVDYHLSFGWGCMYSRTAMARTLWNHENIFGTGIVRANDVNHSTRSGGMIVIFSVFFNMKVCCVF